jgi:bifunctional ADP-heptose synthase (sugar kinase/adenylyltransferase)
MLIPTKARMISDVSGAGDTTIATIAAAIAGGASLQEAAIIANYAAGVVCEEPA